MSQKLTITFAADMTAAVVEVVAPDLQVVERVMLEGGASRNVQVPSDEVFLRILVPSGEAVVLHEPGNLSRTVSREALPSERAPAAAASTTAFASGAQREVGKDSHVGLEVSVPLSSLGDARLLSEHKVLWGNITADDVAHWRVVKGARQLPLTLRVERPHDGPCEIRIPANSQHVWARADRLHDSFGGAIRVRLSTDQPSADAIISYLHRGDLYSAEAMAPWIESDELMAQTEDPYAAAVIGYLLLRLKKFDRLRDWAKYLPDGFDALADGCVVRAWQLIGQASNDRGQIHRHLVEAVERGLPVYTEGLRLLVDGLRLLGADAGEAAARVAERASVILWHSPLTAIILPAAAESTVVEPKPVVYDVAFAAPVTAPPAMEAAQVEAMYELIQVLIHAGQSLDEIKPKLFLTSSNAALVEAGVRVYRERAESLRELTTPPSFREKKIEPWYVGPRASDRFWPAYRAYLRKQKGWGDAALHSLDDASTKTLSLLPPPGAEKVSARGLVVGYIQSGKTTHFTALISKAADVGYRLFIVLSGITDALRNQTQERISREIVELNPGAWFKLTNEKEDFRGDNNAPFVLGEEKDSRIIGVIKKNANRLRKLKQWLKKERKEVLQKCPILLIDDEADQASPNTAKDPERQSSINKLIIELLDLPKVAYVGYTATPFANMLMDPQNLYPKDFIMYLPQPTGYFGPERLFGRAPINWDASDQKADGLDMIRLVPKTEISKLRPARGNKKFQASITPSLEQALRYFWMATAARRFRGQDGHSTMLVHTSESVRVHLSFERPLEDCRQRILAGTRTNAQGLMSELEQQWKQEGKKVSSTSVGCVPVSFAQLRPYLSNVVERTLIRIENSQSSIRIDYSQPGQIYIVVGGNVLSRGLTLEGLTVSLFLRSASAYDTLLQMGRWFGFRVGYEDLPRVWMSEELKGYFYDLAGVEKEIRFDIDRYQDGMFTPLDFGVRIKTHPQLAITSRLKMQHAKTAEMSYNGTAQQTTVFFANRKWLQHNLDAARKLIRGLRADGLVPTKIQDRAHTFLLGASSNQILAFLKVYKIHKAHLNMQTELVSKYIRLENKKGRLKTWNICVVGRERSIYGTLDIGLEAPVPLIRRAGFKRDRGPGAVDIKALMSALDDGVDLPLPSSELGRLGREELRAARDKDAHLADTGLLLLYPIARDSEPTEREPLRKPLGAELDVIGLAMVFPDRKDASKLEYKTVDLSDEPRDEVEWKDEEESAA